MKPNSYGILWTLLLILLYWLTSSFAYAQTTEVTHTETDTHAQFPGGMKALSQYLTTEIVYPAEARENCIEGNVFARFSVSKEGFIGKVIILKGLGFGCNEEVTKVLEAMPAWKPSKKDGQAIDTFVIIPVQFRLTNF